MQKKQSEWKWQWTKVYDDSKWLFTEWIYPNKLKDFKGKTVLDCGCGCGQHLNFVAPYCKQVTGIDLNTPRIAKKNTRQHKNVKVVEGDIAKIRLKKKFDIVYSIGVLHHTDNPSKSFNNIKKMVKKKGKLIVWVYSYEGNFLNRTAVEFLKKHILLRLNKNFLWVISNITAALMYIPIYTIYLLPLRFLPFYQYFQNWRKLGFKRNNQNVFDKLNAPQTFFIKKSTVKKWFNPKEFAKVHISHYKGVSWRGSGVLK
ncbi:class I SAM-dependent methyltransferase [Candidatus Woesearchaeota archaeon]|nr:class I SAM-dependent methyltransferase [Candidatus Woesearchaeota archaeon]